MSTGIDYGMGLTNIDKETGIRYGIIPANCLMGFADEAFEPDYGKPSCGKCGNEAVEYDEEKHLAYAEDGHSFDDYACESCEYRFSNEDAFPEDALSWNIVNEDEEGFRDDYHDVWITKSPYYTLCGFASPCAPGAGYLTSEGDVKAYCLGPSWFDADNPCPYKIYSVEDNSEVEVKA